MSRRFFLGMILGVFFAGSLLGEHLHSERNSEWVRENFTRAIMEIIWQQCTGYTDMKDPVKMKPFVDAFIQAGVNCDMKINGYDLGILAELPDYSVLYQVNQNVKTEKIRDCIKGKSGDAIPAALLAAGYIPNCSNPRASVSQTNVAYWHAVKDLRKAILDMIEQQYQLYYEKSVVVQKKKNQEKDNILKTKILAEQAAKAQQNAAAPATGADADPE